MVKLVLVKIRREEDFISLPLFIIFKSIVIFYSKKNISISMTKWYRDINVWTVIGEAATGIVAFGLLITGFFLPPPGMIDVSVIQAVGEIMGFATIWMMPKAITAGKNIKVEKGSITISNAES